MPQLWGRRFGVPSWFSGPYVQAMFGIGGTVMGGYCLARLAGNPMRMTTDEHGVWRWMTKLDYKYWLLNKAADRARRNPGNEAALLDLEIQRHQLQAEITRAEASSSFSDQDVAIRPHDLSTAPEAALDEDGSPIEGLSDEDMAECARAAAEYRERL